MAEGDIVFVVNPASDNGKTRTRWPEIAHLASKAGLEGEALLSEHRGEIPELVEGAAADGAKLIVAVGGDGTVNEVVNGLLAVRAGGGPMPELGILPRGTGTDFVRTFRIPTRLDDAIRVALEGETREIDAGQVEYRTWDGGTGASHFVNVASAGMSGAIAQRANATSKALGGKVSFLWATLAVFSRWEPGEIAVEVGSERREARMRDVIVANGKYLAGGMKMCPDAVPDDGVFDVLLIGDITKADLMRTLPKVYRGKHLPHPKAELLRGSVVTVDASTALPIELDGEQPGTTPARFEVVPRALRLRVP